MTWQEAPEESFSRALERRRTAAGLSALAVSGIVTAVVYLSLLGYRPSDGFNQAAGCGGAPSATTARSLPARSLPTRSLPTRSLPTRSLPALVGATPHPANAGSLSELTNAVHVLGESAYGDVYAGVAMDTDADQVTVWHKPSSEFDRALKALPGGDKLVIRCAGHSLTELLDVAAALRADQEYWRSRGLPLDQFGPRVDGSCVELQVGDPRRAETELAARYPGFPLCFIKS